MSVAVQHMQELLAAGLVDDVLVSDSNCFLRSNGERMMQRRHSRILEGAPHILYFRKWMFVEI